MNTSRVTVRRASLAAAAAALVLAATAGTTAAGVVEARPAATAAAGFTVADEHDQDDVAFAQQMIPHHRQAVVMARMVRSHGASAEVKALAQKIEKAQLPEIRTMTGWLKAWGEKVPQGMGGMRDMSGTDNGEDDQSATMPGMMGDGQLSRLNRTDGRAFDRMFLTMMIEHHEGALDMARTELQEGTYGPAKDLADHIITSQTAEIAQMRQMLKAE